MTVLQELATQVQGQFERRFRVGDKVGFITLKDDAPKWMKDLCHAAHQDGTKFGMFPDDVRYEFISDVIDLLAENEDEDDARCAVEPSIYTYDLTSWIASRADRYSYCDQALEEYGTDLVTGEGNSTLTLLQMGQRREREEVFEAVLSFLQEQLEEVNA